MLKIMGLSVTNTSGDSRVHEAGMLAVLSQRVQLAWMTQARELLLILVSAAFAEIAGNVAYVTLIERAYTLGSATISVGTLLLVQSVAQVFFAAGAGGLTDQLGFRKAAGLASVTNASLLLALVLARSILLVYIVAFLLMLGRLLLVPARVGLLSQATSKASAVKANSALSIIIGLGAFAGPALAAALLLAFDDFRPSLLVAGLGWLLSLPPLFMMRPGVGGSIAPQQQSLFEEIRVGWRLLRKRTTVRHLLSCLMTVTFVLGTVTPLFTPLSRRLGLGQAGTGVLFAALGFGNLIGPLVASVLLGRLRLPTAMLLAGLTAPLGLMTVGLTMGLEGALVAIAVVAMASAGLNVMVSTVVQRLSRPGEQGAVVGASQTLLGLSWIVSLAITTSVAAVWEQEPPVQTLLLALSGLGVASFLGCWLWNWRSVWRLVAAGGSVTAGPIGHSSRPG